jgi:hypothetical protein
VAPGLLELTPDPAPVTSPEMSTAPEKTAPEVAPEEDPNGLPATDPSSVVDPIEHAVRATELTIASVAASASRTSKDRTSKEAKPRDLGESMVLLYQRKARAAGEVHAHFFERKPGKRTRFSLREIRSTCANVCQPPAGKSWVGPRAERSRFAAAPLLPRDVRHGVRGSQSASYRARCRRATRR